MGGEPTWGHDEESPGWGLRLAAVIPGSLLMFGALITLFARAWDRDRSAMLSEQAMRLTLPLVVAGLFLWAAGLLIVALGQWPLHRSVVVLIAAAGGLALAVVLTWLFLVSLPDSPQGTAWFALIIAGTILASAYVGIAAVAGEGRLVWIMPAATIAILYVMAAWSQLAVDNRNLGVELDLSQAYFNIFVWIILAPAAFWLTILGLVLHEYVIDR